MKRYARPDESMPQRPSPPLRAAHADRVAIVAADIIAAGSPRRYAAAAVRSGRGRKSAHPERRIDPVARARACSAARWCIGCCNRFPIFQPTAGSDAALKYLARNAGGWTEGDREALASGVLALIGDSRFAPVFGPGSRAEVSIAGRLERPGRPPALVSGQIDRLVVTPTEVLIVDYKTNYAPPSAAGRRHPRPMSANSRCIARCWASSIPICRSAPACSGPKLLN